MNVRLPSILLRQSRLLDQMMILSIFLSSVIIVAVQLCSLLVISSSMTADLKNKAVVTADETALLLTDPLYTVDDEQAVRIGEALLSSGRISGIRLVSATSATLLDKYMEEESHQIAPITRSIVYEGIFLGTVELFFSNREIIETRKRLASIALIVVAASIIANFLAYQYIILGRAKKPLKMIFAGIDAIADGNYELLIPETKFVDVNAIINPINEMATRVRMKNFELLEANTLLEQRVAERTSELQKSLNDLHQAQAHLIASEKLSTLGYLSAGMAHELNTPLGAILSSNRLLIDFLDKKQTKLIDFMLTLDKGGRNLYNAVLALGMRQSTTLEIPLINRKQIKEIQQKLEGDGIPNSQEVAEYLVDLGVSHHMSEFLDLLKTGKNAEILSFVAEPIVSRRMAEIVEVAAQKAANVISALRSYLSPEANDLTRIVEVDRDIEKVLLLMNNMLKHGIHVQCEFSGVQVHGSSDKLSQVWINLIRNAAQAMEFKGDLTIRTETRDDHACVSITDSGPGIPESIRNRIFEPFFTTKKEGEGMGLGLDICSRIVAAHRGAITVKSRPGCTEFIVMLPVAAGEEINSVESRRAYNI
jgi:signal transduction histidine kinase